MQDLREHVSAEQSACVKSSESIKPHTPDAPHPVRLKEITIDVLRVKREVHQAK